MVLEPVRNNIDLSSRGNPAIDTTFKFLLERPDLLGDNTQTAIYAQFSGIRYPSESIYAQFTSYIKFYNAEYVSQKRSRAITQMDPLLLQYDPSLIITWARSIQHSKKIVEFEPIHRTLNAVFNNFFDMRQVFFRGTWQDIGAFKPLCYTKTGDSFYELLPYICYVMTFLIHCKPYAFNEVTANSSVHGFNKSLNDWYMRNYKQLGDVHGVDIVAQKLETAAVLDKRQRLLNEIPEKDMRTMFNYMLDPEQIIRIRNDELLREPDLLNMCVSDQNGIPEATIKNAFDLTMSAVLDIIVEETPFRTIFNSIPRFNPRAINLNELMAWTQYALSGASKSFCVEPGFFSELKQEHAFSYSLHDDPRAIKQLPNHYFGPQKLNTAIKPLNISYMRPFSCSDLILEMCTAYVRKKFEEQTTDVLQPTNLRVDESDLKFDAKNVLLDTFIQGLYMYDNSSLVAIFHLLESNAKFKEQFEDIFGLDTLTMQIYNNTFASHLIVPYILSFLPAYFLDTCLRGLSFSYFDLCSYVFNSELSELRVTKLANVLLSLMLVRSSQYARFVNEAVTQFTEILTMNPIIYLPYVKGLTDAADFYAIGGIELYNYAHYSNPLIRAYGVYSLIYMNMPRQNTDYFARVSA
jgi:hypothetical protein